MNKKLYLVFGGMVTLVAAVLLGLRGLPSDNVLGATPSNGGFPGIYNATGTDLVLRDGYGSALAVDQNGRAIINSLGTYNASGITLADGATTSTRMGANGALLVQETQISTAEDNTNSVIATQNKPLAVSTYAWDVDKSAALEASSITKATPGVLRKVWGRIDTTAASGNYFIQVLNSATLPADGAVTSLVAPIKKAHTTGANTDYELDLTQNGVYASAGITLVFSTTEFTKTISTASSTLNALFK